MFKIIAESICVSRDSKRPLLEWNPLYRMVSPLAQSVDDFFVSQNRSQCRTPIDQRFGLIRESKLVLVLSNGGIALP